MHEDQPRLQKLLRRENVVAFASNGPSQLRKWIPVDLAGTYASGSAPLEKTANDLCQFDERPISSKDPCRLHHTSSRKHEPSSLASIPNTNKTILAVTCFRSQH